MTIKKVAKRLKARLLGTARTDQTIAAAKAFAEQGAWEATIASLADIVTSESTPTATRRLYVTALRRAGRLEEAAAEIGIALAMHPNDLGLLIES